MTMQLEGDRGLLKFNTYEEYLLSMVTCQDLTNLQSTLDARQIAELGYRSSGDTLTREEFNKRLKAVRDYFFPKISPDVVSARVDIDEIFLQELALREEGNRNGKLATIIYIRSFTKNGYEVSGYIDYAQRLHKQDWLPIFQGKIRLWPRQTDLSYYHWQHNTIKRNDSLNFKVLIDPVQGLLFQCWHDRKVVNVDPTHVSPWHTTRATVPTVKYEQVVLYDHVVRRRC